MSKTKQNKATERIHCLIVFKTMLHADRKLCIFIWQLDLEGLGENLLPSQGSRPGPYSTPTEGSVVTFRKLP